jgi:hypothetical protein
VARKEQLAMDLRPSASFEVAGVKQPDVALPPVRIVIDIDPQSVSPDGNLDARWRVTTARVQEAPQPPSQIADGMRAEVAAIEHLRGGARVSSRGISLGVSIDADSLVDAGATGQMVEQVRQTLRDVAAPLPEEEVGLGARWQKITQLDAKETPIAQTETFTLTASHGSEGTLDAVLAQTAPAQPLYRPGTDASPARIDSMLASGNAKEQFDLTRLVPRTRFDGTTTMVASGPSASEGDQRVTVIMRVSITIQGTTR